MESAWRENKSLKNQLKFGAIALLVAVGSAACHGGGRGGGGGGPIGGGPDPYRQPWYDVYGYVCGYDTPRPGCNFYSDGYKIIDVEDPYFYSSYNLRYDYWQYTDSYGYTDYYYGWGWVSPNGILYDDWGYALNESGKERGRDMMSDMAAAETQLVEKAADSLADRFALSGETSLKVARTLNDWASLGKKRGRTEKDVADFSQRLYGVSVEKAAAALISAKQGDLSGVESVNTEIAGHWNTDAETSKEILKTWYGKEMAELAK